MKKLFIWILVILPFIVSGQFYRTHSAILPSVQMVTETSIGSTSAYLYGYVLPVGGIDIIERGFVWSTSINPDTTDNVIQSGIGFGQFDEPIIDLIPSTTYYVNTYAINAIGIVYGVYESFNTLPANNTPTVTTTAITGIDTTFATSGGNVTNDGGSTVTARGVCWNYTGTPTISDNITTNGTGTGSFSSSITGLTKGTIVYVKAYATNSTGTGYGEDLSFTTTTNLPTVYTTSITEIATNYATAGGNVTNDGGSPVIEKGVAYGLSANPTSGTPGGNGTGSFSVSLSYLTPNTLYHYRGYAENVNGVAYGGDSTFTTDNITIVVPTVLTTALRETRIYNPPISHYALVFGGNVTASGGGQVTERGYVVSLTDNTPTIGEPTVTKHIVGSGLGIFLDSTRMITPGANYYVRAYGINSAGVGYGYTESITACIRPTNFTYAKWAAYVIIVDGVSTEFWHSGSLALQACTDANDTQDRIVYEIVQPVYSHLPYVSQTSFILYWGNNTSCDVLMDGHYLFLENAPQSDRIVQIWGEPIYDFAEGSIFSISTCN